MALAVTGCATAHITGNLGEGQKVPRPVAIYYTPVDTSTGSWKAQGASLEAPLRSWILPAAIRPLPFCTPKGTVECNRRIFLARTGPGPTSSVLAERCGTTCKASFSESDSGHLLGGRYKAVLTFLLRIDI
jgi:hypothetical protein